MVEREDDPQETPADDDERKPGGVAKPQERDGVVLPIIRRIKVSPWYDYEYLRYIESEDQKNE